MPVTFDGTQKLIICTLGTTTLNVQTIYSEWKEWVQSGIGISYLPAFEAIGGQPLPGGLFAGQTFFLINNWKIKPQPANHRLIVVGNLYTNDGSPITISVAGYTIEISLSTSAQAQGIQSSGSTLNLIDIENSLVLAKKSDITELRAFIVPYLTKIEKLWTGSGFDPANPISALSPTPTTLGWIKTQNNSINQTHILNQDGSYTLRHV